MNPLKVALIGAAAFAFYEAFAVRQTGYDVFYTRPVEGEYRDSAMVKWLAAGAAAGALAVVVK